MRVPLVAAAGSEARNGLFLHALARREARGTDALVAMLAAGTKLRGAALTAEGAATVATAAKILDGLLEADLLRCGRAFVEAGGFAALRVCVACAQLGGPRGLEVKLLHLFMEENGREGERKRKSKSGKR